MDSNYDGDVYGETASIGAQAEVAPVCPECHGTGIEDIWDPDDPPCMACYGTGEAEPTV